MERAGDFMLEVKTFFDQLSSDYDQSIQRIIPPYREIFETLIDYCFLDKQAPLRILELGCGTGNLSLLLSRIFPKAQLTLVDLSPEMLQQASEKLAEERQRVTLVEGSFTQLDLPANGFDMVISSFALHHLEDPDKAALYQDIYTWLKPGGLLRVTDGTRILPTDIGDPFLMDRWRRWVKATGASDEECEKWMEHSRNDDKCASLIDHFKWLEAVGFEAIDCYWKRLHLTIYGAQKPIS